MKNKNRSCWFGALFILVFLGICALAGQVVSMVARQNSLQSRPLVLIHSPVNHEQIVSGEAVSIHATARSPRGVTRMELWLDDRLFAAQPAGETGAHSPFVLNESWLATAGGPHVIQVRAVSANGVEGQAAITVEVSESAQMPTHTVAEGETFADIAEASGLTPAELAALNPDANPGELAPGDSLTVADEAGDAQDGGSPPAAPEVPVADEDAAPPEADAPEPGSFFELGTLFGVYEIFDPVSSAPIELRLEVLSLETSQAYDNLHCYIGVGESLPRWYPDADFNQLTDESFALTDAGWNVSDYYAGANAPLFAWPGDQPLPFSMECVGVLGGVEALPAGSLALTVPPEAWDGVTRTESGGGEEASFQIQYRILRADSVPHGIPIFIDPSMTAPSNLWIEDRRYALHWDYEPRPDEAGIEGFRIYLNGTLQWSVRNSEARQSDIPPEWFHPPCGDEYQLSVSAYRYGYPDGPESVLATPPVSIVTPPDECQKRIEITFVSLETFELGSDGRYEDRTGDVGPVYGTFFANEQQFSIDARPPEDGNAWVDNALGLEHNHLYTFSEIFSDSSWRVSGSPSMVVDIEPGGTFQYGFRLMDEDTGRCHDSGDPGCDDLVCDGASFILQDHYGNLDTPQEQTLHSDNDRCMITVRFGPAPGSIVSSAGDGPALPQLNVSNYRIEDATNTIRYEIFNAGSGTWPTQPLELWYTDREGNRLDSQRLADFRLEPGQSRAIEYVSRFNPPDVCIMLDPNNAMLERYESDGMLGSARVFCPEEPDLVITDVEYDPEASNLVVNIQNIGEQELVGREVRIDIPGETAGTTALSATRPDVHLRRYGSLALVIPLAAGQRESLSRGYHVLVDPQNRITESNEDNNQYRVAGPIQYWVTWHNGCTSGYVVGLQNDIHTRLEASLSGATGEEALFSWSAPEVSGFSTFEYKCWGFDRPETNPTYASERFFLMGDQQLKIRISTTVDAGAEHYSVGVFETVISPDDPYSAFVDGFSPVCDASWGDVGYYTPVYRYPGEGYRPDPGQWSTLFKVCRAADY